MQYRLELIKTHSLLVPLMTTVCALIKCGHWFVSRSDLNLFEVSSIVFALGKVCTKYCGLVNILPGVFTTKDIIDFFPF